MRKIRVIVLAALVVAGASMLAGCVTYGGCGCRNQFAHCGCCGGC